MVTGAGLSEKQETLRDLFGAREVEVRSAQVLVDGVGYPVVDGVIVLSPPGRRSPRVAAALEHGAGLAGEDAAPFAADVQRSFGWEWETYDALLPEHVDEFERYFDLVDLDALADTRVCDLGCGSGRFSALLAPRVRELVLVDFSDAIFAAQRNLSGHDNCILFQADLTALPFRDGFAGLLFCLGVLHHLPRPALEVARELARLSPRLLLFLYYALDNRPAHYRWLLRAVNAARLGLCRVERRRARQAIARAGARFVYQPLVELGRQLDRWDLGSQVPLYDFYRDKGLARIEQDVYDRFFTRIEQRFSRREIGTLADTFSQVHISEQLPYWHFLCER